MQEPPNPNPDHKPSPDMETRCRGFERSTETLKEEVERLRKEGALEAGSLEQRLIQEVNAREMADQRHLSEPN